MNIELVDFDNNFVPPQDGKYLVRVKTPIVKDMTSINYKQARIKKYQDKDKNDLYTIDVDNTVITHISKMPLS